MGEPGNPTEPDPEQPGWASPTPPPPPPDPGAPPPPDPGATPTSPQPPTAPAPTYQQPPSEPTPPGQPPVPPAGPPTEAPAWGAPPPAWGAQQPAQPAWGAPPPGGAPPPAPGGGWGPTGPPGPQPKKRRLTWVWFLIPVLAIFVASFVVIIVFAVKLIGGPIDATNDYYAELESEQYADAYDHLCRSLRLEYTESEFVQLLAGEARSKGVVDDYDFDNSDVNSNADTDDEIFSDATVTGTVERGESEYHTRVRLRKEDGDWKVCAVAER